MFPENLKYTDTHEWVRIEENIAIIGITDYAQHQLGDIVYVDLPETDTEIEKGDAVINLEAVKAVEDVYSPLSGTIIEVNEALQDTPELINQEPYDGGWIIKIEMSNADEAEELMGAQAYENSIED